ncbi:MAG: glycoside hydrolase family 140 protein [Acidobacteriia bacterium]|nr:glycoside hydrolase family 140 protein [Terriglobia bacterium]
MKTIGAFLLLSVAACAQLKISGNGKYLVNSSGTPVFLQAEDGWALSNELSNADADTYLIDRASRGFNAIWIGAADNVYQDGAPNNNAGQAPFSGADFTNENSAFWAHVDFIVSEAAKYGITIFLDPGFVGLLAADGYLTSYQSSSQTVLTNYGAFLGARYKNSPNIVWVLGGDWDPSLLSVTRLGYLAAGIVSQDTNHLMTVEVCRFCTPSNQSSMDAWTASTPIQINWVYAPYVNVQASCASNYARSGALPAVMGEDHYEGENGMTALTLRQEGYWGILSGCTLGRVWGNNPIWCFDSAKAVASCNTGTTWQSALSSAGSTSQQYLGQLMRSREHWKLVPDTSHAYLTGGFGSGSTLSVLARTSDGQTMIAYFSDGNATNKMINMAGIISASSTVHAWWFNPQTSARTDLGTFPSSGTRTFTALDGNDWVLVLDDNSASLPPPGAKPIAPIGVHMTVH